MRKFVLISWIIILVAAGCSTFQISTGIGYRKCPPDFTKPVLYDMAEKNQEELKTLMTAKGVPAEYIEWLIGLISVMDPEYALPKDNRVDFGWYFEAYGK